MRRCRGSGGSSREEEKREVLERRSETKENQASVWPKGQVYRGIRAGKGVGLGRGQGEES